MPGHYVREKGREEEEEEEEEEDDDDDERYGFVNFCMNSWFMMYGYLFGC